METELRAGDKCPKCSSIKEVIDDLGVHCYECGYTKEEFEHEPMAIECRKDAGKNYVEDMLLSIKHRII